MARTSVSICLVADHLANIAHKYVQDAKDQTQADGQGSHDQGQRNQPEHLPVRPLPQCSKDQQYRSEQQDIIEQA